jgi:hypothetical protein
MIFDSAASMLLFLRRVRPTHLWRGIVARIRECVADALMPFGLVGPCFKLVRTVWDFGEGFFV